MFRRSIVIFLAAAVLGLLLTVGYALTGLSGPQQTIEEAEQALRGDRAAEAVRLLDMTERSPGIERQPDLMQRLLQARYRSHRRLGNSRRALADLEALLARTTPAPDDLLLDRVALLATLGEGADALTVARTFLATRPDHPRGLELAGEAAQVAYREPLAEAAATVRRDLAGPDQAEGSRALLHYLYRPDGDAGQTAGYDDLRALYRTRAARQQAWHGLEPELRTLRRSIQEGLDLFRRSLEAGGQPVAAFRGLSFALEQADRTDDVVALGEVYLRRFDHLYTAEAAGFVAAEHFAHGLLDAAVEVAQRFLPPGKAADRQAANKLNDRVEALWITTALAFYRQGDRSALQTLARDTRAMVAADVRIPLANHLANGLSAVLAGDDRSAESNLAAVTNLLSRSPSPVHPTEVIDLLMELRLGLMQKRGAKEAEQQDLIDVWLRAPGSGSGIGPLLVRARLHLDAGRGSAALATTGEALRRRPQDEDVLHLLASAAEACYAAAGQDGKGLLAQCERRQTTVPEVPSPVCYLLAAEAALAAGVAPVARDCARKAIDKFTWARWPRMLEARAALLAGDAAQAATLLEKLLTLFPGDGPALRLLLQARQQQGQSLGPLLWEIVRKSAPDSHVAEALLRTALADRDVAVAASLSRGATRLPEASGSLHALRARALARAGQQAAATAALGEALVIAGRGSTPLLRADLLDASLTLLLGRARTASDTELERDALAAVRLCTASGPRAYRALLEAAIALDEAGKGRAAFALVSAALDLADGEQLRSGAAFALAGRLALQGQQYVLAENLLTAAVSFADGAAAAPSLARLCLLQRKRDKAAAVMQLLPQVEDPSLLLALGDDQGAALRARERLTASPTDLVAGAVLGLLGQAPAEAFGSGLLALPQADREDLRRLLVSAGDPALAHLALPRLRTIAEAAPDSGALRLLLARCLAQAGAHREAAALHRDLLAAGVDDLLVLMEATRAAWDPAHAMAPTVMAEVRRRGLSPDLTVPAPMRVIAVQLLAAEAAAAGRMELAQQLLADLWLRDPTGSRLSLDNARSLMARPALRPKAWQLLDGLRHRLGHAEQRTCLDMLFGLGDAMATAGDHGIDELTRASAQAVTERDGPQPAAVWFLLRFDQRRQAAGAKARVSDAEALRLLRTVLALPQQDGAQSWTLRLLDFLAARAGDTAALVACEDLLTRHPAALPVWQRRAELLARTQLAEGGIADLRAMLAYADDPALLIATIGLSARYLILAPEDGKALDALPEAHRRGPDFAMARGLVALRQGAAADADRWLAGALAGNDGAHLYYRALAALMQRTEGTRLRAQQLFAELATSYPSSSLARYAGSFARQLSLSP